MDEVLDLVNELDEVIGEVNKLEAHLDKTLIHRETGILIVDKDNKILLQQRSADKKTYPLMWVLSAGGHIRKGCNPDKEVHRELIEELGFDTKLIFLGKSLDYEPKESHFAYIYYGKYNNEKMVFPKDEVNQVRFFSKEELISFFKLDESPEMDERGFYNGLGKKCLKLCMKYWDGGFNIDYKI